MTTARAAFARSCLNVTVGVMHSGLLASLGPETTVPLPPFDHQRLLGPLDDVRRHGVGLGDLGLHVLA
jgi:hypothetical protein